MFKRKIIYSVFIGLAIAGKTSISANQNQTKSDLKKQVEAARTKKIKTLVLGASATGLALVASIVYQHLHEKKFVLRWLESEGFTRWLVHAADYAPTASQLTELNQ